MDGSYYNYGTTSSNPSGGVATGIIIGIYVVIMIMCIILIIAQWKMYKKGNKPGWAALVPVYDQIVQCQMVGVSPWWILISMIPIVGSIAAIYFMILLSISTARAFGKSDGFGIGLMFLPFIFYPIIGIGNAQFIGMNPMDDIIFKKKPIQNQNGVAQQVQPMQQNMNANTGQPVQQNVQQPVGQTQFITCPNCGNNIQSGIAVCPYCGNRLQ